MALQTEAVNDRSEGLDQQGSASALARLAEGQVAAAQAVAAALPAIEVAARLMARCLSGSGRVIYAGAGSSGLMAMADALELPGTYGIDPERIVILLAGGMADLKRLPGGPEDDRETARAEIAALFPGPADLVIAVSASGSTPYVLAIADFARQNGVPLVAMANNAGAPLFDGAEAAILLATPPELVAGSTRMGAATAQKIAFNMMSTLAAILMGHVHDGHMVNLIADNDKLRARARRIVAEIAGVEEALAERHLAAAGGAVKSAVLLAAGAGDGTTATRLLSDSGGHLRPALQRLAGQQRQA